MASPLIGAGSCCNPCPSPIVENVPGQKGDPGECVPCVDGVNAYTLTGEDFTMPAVGGSLEVLVGNSIWISLNQALFLEGAGYLRAIARNDDTHVTLQNLGVSVNAAPGTIIPPMTKLSPAGEEGASAAVIDIECAMHVKQPARVATTGPITLSGEQPIDGVNVVAGDRVLVKDQASAIVNGIYVCALGVWSRSLDADRSECLHPGPIVYVEEGVVNADLLFALDAPDPVTLGVDDLDFFVYQSISAGNGLVFVAPETIHFAQSAAYTVDQIPFATGATAIGFDANFTFTPASAALTLGANDPTTGRILFGLTSGAAYRNQIGYNLENLAADQFSGNLRIRGRVDTDGAWGGTAVNAWFDMTSIGAGTFGPTSATNIHATSSIQGGPVANGVFGMFLSAGANVTTPSIYGIDVLAIADASAVLSADLIGVVLESTSFGGSTLVNQTLLELRDQNIGGTLSGLRYAIRQLGATDINSFAGPINAGNNIIQSAGSAQIRMIRGEIYQNDTGATTALTLQNTWYPILTTWTASALNNNVTETTGTGRLTPQIAGTYLVLFSLSAAVNATNEQIEATVLKSGSEVLPATAETKYAVSGTAYVIGGQALIAMNGTTDYLQLGANDNDSAGKTLTVDHASLTCIRIGD